MRGAMKDRGSRRAWVAAAELLQADGGVHAAVHGIVIKPARRDGLGLRIKLHRLLAIRTKVAKLGAARAGEAEVGNRHRDRQVEADLADTDALLERAGHGAGLG